MKIWLLVTLLTGLMSFRPLTAAEDARVVRYDLEATQGNAISSSIMKENFDLILRSVSSRPALFSQMRMSPSARMKKLNRKFPLCMQTIGRGQQGSNSQVKAPALESSINFDVVQAMKGSMHCV